MLDTLNIIDESVIKTPVVESVGRDQHNKYHSDQAPHTLDSRAQKIEVSVPHPMPNTQDQDKTNNADPSTLLHTSGSLLALARTTHVFI